jgi:predicted phosphodiesterase
VPKYSYPRDDDLVKLIQQEGSVAGAAFYLHIPDSTLKDHIYRNPELREAVADVRKQELSVGPGYTPNDIDTAVHKILKKGEASIESVADYLEVPPKTVRSSVERLRHAGFRIQSTEEELDIVLDKVVPTNTPGLRHKSTTLLDGNQVRVGVVSDTHLSSNEEALEELHVAYDKFEQEGITEVWHAGDWTCGRGIFRGQDIEIKHHTFETQVDYLVANYPHREGIVTRGIAGNHDIEGDFGRIGADPVQALANQREDIEYLGPYTAWIELPGGAWVHLLHGKGSMSYAYSYKAQKLVQGYAAGRKPAVLIVGHWHVNGNIEDRAVQVLFPSCFEWRGFFLERIGLTPSVGFNIITMTIGDDGSLVGWAPHFYRFHEGRSVV